MLLPDHSIRELLISNEMIQPWSDKNIQPASYDVSLSDTFVYGDRSERASYFVLRPGQFVLGSTIETLRIPKHLYSRFEGKSSLGRLGLMTHVTAGFIDPGFCGQLTVELCNVSATPIRLYTGMLIGQLCFGTLTAPAENPYGSSERSSHYQGQAGATMAYQDLRQQLIHHNDI